MSLSPRLVRNVSLPLLTPPAPSKPRAVPRVSSFSRLPPQPPTALYTPPPLDSDDGLVPQLTDPPSEHSLPSDTDSVSSLPDSPPSPPPSPPQMLLYLSPFTQLLLPPTPKPSPHRHLLYFLSLTSLFIPPSLLLLFYFPSLLYATLPLLFLPSLPRLGLPLSFSSLVAAAAIIFYSTCAATIVAPGMLVWTGLVPVLVLGTHDAVAALGASGIVAAVLVGIGGIVGRVVAAWVVFLGIAAMVNKVIRKLTEQWGPL